MKKTFSILSLSLIFSLAQVFAVSCTIDDNDDNNRLDELTDDAQSDEAELASALEYLNAVRKNPSAYSKEIGVDLSAVVPLHELKWNDTLAKVAHAKAEDMVARGYFGHVDPDGYGMNIKINEAGYALPESWCGKSNNNFESLAAGYPTGEATVIQLINDGGADNENAGHRRHLLGIDSFWANCYDIGIGVAHGGKYGTYWCFLVAKHDF